MKVKLDFVTNSSSTGFVFYGYQVPLSHPALKDVPSYFEDELRERLPDLPKCIDIYWIPQYDYLVVGKSVMCVSDSNIDEVDFDIEQFKDAAKRSTDAARKFFVLGDQKPKLIGGAYHT